MSPLASLATPFAATSPDSLPRTSAAVASTAAAAVAGVGQRRWRRRALRSVSPQTLSRVKIARSPESWFATTSTCRGRRPCQRVLSSFLLHLIQAQQSRPTKRPNDQTTKRPNDQTDKHTNTQTHKHHADRGVAQRQMNKCRPWPALRFRPGGCRSSGGGFRGSRSCEASS